MTRQRLGFILVLCVVVIFASVPVRATFGAASSDHPLSLVGAVPRLGDGPPDPGGGLTPAPLMPPDSAFPPAAAFPTVAEPLTSATTAVSPQPVLAVSPEPLTCGLLADFEQSGGWTSSSEPTGTLVESAEQRYSGAFSAKVSYNFSTGGNDYIAFQRAIPLGGQGTALTAWVYGDGSGHYLLALVQDSQGETWSFPFGQIQHAGWQQMIAPLDVLLPWPAGHVSGPSNGVLDYPIQFNALVLDDMPDTFVGSGTLYVDDLACSETLGGANLPPPPAFVLNGSLAGNAGGLLSGTLGDLIQASALAAQPGGATQPATGMQTAAQSGGAQPGGTQPGGGQWGGQPGGGQTGAQTGLSGSTANCALSVISPPNGATMPDGQPIKFEWTLNRTLAPDEYFFVVVTYPSQGKYALGGTFKDLSVAGREVMDGIRYNSYVMGRTSYTCSDTGQYYWQIQVRRQTGAAPDSNDPVLCFSGGGLTWKPWPNCTSQSPVAVAPTTTPAVPGIAVLPTDTPAAPAQPPAATAGEPAPVTAVPCGLTLVSPRHGARFGPEAKPLSLVWSYDRVLPDNQYFFVEVQYIKKDYEGQAGLGTRYQVGSYKDAANRVPEELRWTAERHGEWMVPGMLCLPGFSDDGWYQWTISVREKVMAQPSSFDKVICQSDVWSFNWTGCQQTNTSTCQLTLTAPPNNGQINPESRTASLGWQMNRALTPDEYYFVTVTYSHAGQQQRYGSWDESGYISNLRESRLDLWKPYILCADDGWYNWTVYVARRQGTQPAASDAVVCQSASGRFQWALCEPTDYQTQPQPTSGAPAAGCQVTLLGPPSGARFGPETENVVLQWQNNRPLNAQEYFFVNVEYPHGGLTWYDGTWRDAAQQRPDGTRDTQFALRKHLCQPGFSDTGQYTWYVVVMHQLGAEKSLHDGVLCQSEKRVFSWTGCAPPATPEPEYEDDDDSDGDEDD